MNGHYHDGKDSWCTGYIIHNHFINYNKGNNMTTSNKTIKLSEVHPNTKGNPEVLLLLTKETKGHRWYKNPYTTKVIRVKRY